MTRSDVAARPRRWRWVAIVLAQLVVGLPLLEGALRLALGPGYVVPLVPLPATADQFDMRRGGTRTDGGASHYDADGFRDEPHASPGGRTILFVGDSFTQGYGVPDGASFVARAEEALLARGVPARCLNAGLSGLGTSQELVLLRRLLDRAPADAVVLQVFPFNDLEDNHRDGSFELVEGRLHELTPVREIVPPPSPMLAALEELYVVRVIESRTRRRSSYEPDEAAYELERALLREVVATTTQHRAQLLIALVGERDECGGHADDGPHARVAALLREMPEVPVVDLCEAAPARDDYREDGHYTVEANVRVGRALAEHLAPMLAP